MAIVKNAGSGIADPHITTKVLTKKWNIGDYLGQVRGIPGKSFSTRWETGAAPPPTPSIFIGEWLFNEGDPAQTLIDNSGNGLHALRGGLVDVDARDPVWVATGLDFTPLQRVTVPYNAALVVTDITLACVTKPDVVTGNQVLIARSTTGANIFQFRLAGSAVQFLGFNGGTITVASAVGQAVIGEWALFTARVTGTAVTVRKNGVEIASGTLLAPISAELIVDLIIGARGHVDHTAEGLNGIISYASFAGLSDDTKLLAIEQAARTAAAAKGITIP